MPVVPLRPVCLAAALCAPSIAFAAPAEPEIDDVGHPDHGLHGGPAPDSLAPAEGPLNGDEPHVLFVNFDGVTLTEAGWDNATQNQTQFPGWGGTYEPFGEAPGGTQREAVLAEVRADYEGLNLVVTDERPASGQYTMLIVSPTNGSPGKLGFASVGCGGSNPAGIGFAFFRASQNETADKIATTVSHEAAHTLGIEHSGNNVDIMYPNSVGGAPSFVVGCHPIQGNEYCGSAHQQLCPAGQQDTFGELTGVLGAPAIPDDSPPEVAIVSPADSTQLELGDLLDVVVDATDDVGVSEVDLLLDGTLMGTDDAAPYEWALDGFPEGVYTLRAVARDAAGNEASSAQVTIAVGDAMLPDPDPGDEGGDTGFPDEGGTDGLGADDEGAGCGCRSTGAGSGGAWGLGLLVLVGLCRRRVRRLEKS